MKDVAAKFVHFQQKQLQKNIAGKCLIDDIADDRVTQMSHNW